MFEKLAEDIAYLAQIKLATLAEQVEKTARTNYGKLLRRQMALAKKIKNTANTAMNTYQAPPPGMSSAEHSVMREKQVADQLNPLVDSIRKNNVRLNNAAARGNRNAGVGPYDVSKGQGIQNAKIMEKLNPGYGAKYKSFFGEQATPSATFNTLVGRGQTYDPKNPKNLAQYTAEAEGKARGWLGAETRAIGRNSTMSEPRYQDYNSLIDQYGTIPYLNNSSFFDPSRIF